MTKERTRYLLSFLHDNFGIQLSLENNNNKVLRKSAKNGILLVADIDNGKSAFYRRVFNCVQFSYGPL